MMSREQPLIACSKLLVDPRRVVHPKVDGEGRPSRELLERRDGFVIRAVVPGDELVGEARLGGEALDLRSDETPTVAAAEGDRQAHSRAYVDRRVLSDDFNRPRMRYFAL